MENASAVRVIVRGSTANFPRPEFRQDRVSYDVITPGAARGVLDRIHWRPAIRWVVDAVSVLRPIQFSEPATAADAGVDGRSISLRDVGYVIDAHFEMTRRAGPADDPVRHRGMFKRQIRAGAKVFLGSENHPGEATLLSDADEEPSPVDVTCDLGWMVHEADYEDRRRLRFFRAHLVRGVIAVPCPGSALLFG